jgi:hypothetical protein
MSEQPLTIATHAGIRQDPTGSVWTDDPPNVSRPDRSGADQIDAEHQVRIWRLGVRIPRGALRALENAVASLSGCLCTRTCQQTASNKASQRNTLHRVTSKPSAC